MIARGRALLASYWTPAGRRALGNLGVLAACTAVAQGFGFWALVIVTGGLGPEGYSTIALGNSVQWYLIVLGTMSLPSLVVRDLTQAPAERDRIVSAFLGLTAAAAVTSGVLTAAAVWVLPLQPTERVYLTAVALCNVAACLNLSPLYDVEHRQAVAALLQLPFDVLNPFALLALRGSGALTVETVAAVYAGRVVLAAVAPAVVFHRFVRPIRWRWDAARARELLRGGWPSVVTTLVAMVPFHGGLFLVRRWHGEHATGLYGLAVTVAFAYFAVGMMGVRVVQPHVAGVYGTDRRFVRQLAVFAAGFLVLLAAAAVGAAYVLIFHVLDPVYRPAYPSLILLVTAMAFFLTAVFANCYLIRFRRERLMMGLFAVSAGLFCMVATLFPSETVWPVAGLAAAASGLLAGASWVAVWRSWPPAPQVVTSR